MKRTAVAVLAAMLVLAGAESALAENTSDILEGAGVSGNTHKIDQKGDGNDGLIEQLSSSNSAQIEQGSKKSLAYDNEAAILQEGAGYNSAAINQKGDLNAATIEQNGGYNHAEIKQSNPTLVINSNVADILQQGSNNRAIIEQMDIDGNGASIQQVGDYTGVAGISQQGGSNNAADIVQISAFAGTGPLHTANINQGSSKDVASTNSAMIHQWGDGEAVEVLLEDSTTTVVMVGHSAGISQKGYSNRAEIAQWQNGISDVATISQEGIGNVAIGIQGAGF